MEKWTVDRVKACKGRHKLACLTAYDWATARLLDAAGIELVLVGDSVGTVALGYETTLPVTMADMLHHTAAVARGVRQALVVADMPFMSYQASVEQALRNAGRFLKESGADAVKVEGGGRLRIPAVRALVENGIPVLGHIGLTPQSIRELGGHKVQGRTEERAERLIEEATALDRAGVFAIVVECVPAALGERITRGVQVPTIGIGAGPDCDGQVLVTPDLLGIDTGVSPRFVKRYAELGNVMRQAFEAYRRDVENGAYPAEEHCY